MFCKSKNEVGNTFGRLTVKSREPTRNGKAAWLCECLCGRDKVVTGDSLRTGKVKSCGCFQKESRKTHRKTHGMTKTRTYKSWQEMHTRCKKESSISFKNYGARGVNVDTTWDSFEVFFSDMGERPKSTSLDRVDSLKGYSKSNCRWSTRLVQNRNRRSNILFTYKGETKCLAEWCTALGLSYTRTYQRLKVQKLSVIDAFENPFKVHKERNFRSQHDTSSKI